LVGNEIHVDVYVDIKDIVLDGSDDLGSTLNYETIYQLCRLEMKKPVKLLETTAINIHRRIHSQYQDKGIEVKVRISKISPPLNGPVDRAYIEISG
jgi:dihydroneopterin aldolase